MQNIYYQGNKRKQVPSNQNAKRLESFFNAAAVLMTNQLQMLALNSIDDFTKLFCPPPVRFWFCFYIGAERVLISILQYMEDKCTVMFQLIYQSVSQSATVVCVQM